MELSKTNLNIIGVGGLIIAVVFGGFFLIRPQITSAQEFNTMSETVAMSVENQTLRVGTLKEASGNIPELQAQVDSLARAFPQVSDVGGIGRVVVEALDNNQELVSFQHFTPTEFTAPATPKADIAATGAELEATRGKSGATAPVVTAPPKEANPQSRIQEFVEAAPKAVPLKQVPITITIQATSEEEAAAYVDRLSKGSRAILVQGVSLTGEENTTAPESEGTAMGVQAVIYAYAFVNGQQLL